MIKILILFINITAVGMLYGQDSRYGIADKYGKPIVGATVTSIPGQARSVSDGSGYFTLTDPYCDSIHVRTMSYRDTAISMEILRNSRAHSIVLEPEDRLIETVYINTGYYRTPIQHATGSVAHISSEQFGRSLGTTVLSRIEDMAPGLQFDRTKGDREGDERLDIRVRGLGTIHSETMPLIVLDNFPFVGDLNDINPNDIESVTILKDASAAAIWGARAGNGVIVVNTKQGKKGSPPQILISANTNVLSRPDLFYSQNYVAAADIMDIQERLYLNGHYRERNDILIPEYVELLIRKKNNAMDETQFQAERQRLMANDFRREASEYLYQSALNSQYNIEVRGGGNHSRYMVSGMREQYRETIVGNKGNKSHINSNTDIQLRPSVSLDLKLNYVNSNSQQNGYSMGSLSPSGYDLPSYTSFFDENGYSHKAVPQKNRMAYTATAQELGLLDWGFYPLQERGLVDHRANSHTIRLNTGITTDIMHGLKMDVRYGWQNIIQRNSSLYDEDSWYTRNLTNTYTQADGSLIIPAGAISQGGNNQRQGHTGRVQLDYGQKFGKGKVHGLDLLAGSEIRQETYRTFPGYAIYGYDPELYRGTTMLDYVKFHPTRPRGSGRIPGPQGVGGLTTERFVSYFSRMGYRYADRLSVNGSARWDGSNLFGVRTNQKGVPLWSLGTGYLFYRRPAKFMTYLNGRLSYGSNGNVNRQVSSLPVVVYTTSAMTRLPMAILNSVGNPDLRWERVNTTNMGLDVRFWADRISLTLDAYQKQGKDLIGENYLDPTTGIFEFNATYEIDNKINYANIRTKGIDFVLNSQNVRGEFSWGSSLMASYTRNRITEYMSNVPGNIHQYFSASAAPPEKGVSKDVIYALPWQGLDSETGNPLTPDRDFSYVSYFNGLRQADLLDMGTSVAPWYGTFINTVGYRNLSLSLGVVWKAGYKFRRNSIEYGQLLDLGRGHVDYLRRWQQPGDERMTDVPSLSLVTDASRDQMYKSSELLIEPGDHIRLKDLRVSYAVSDNMVRRLGLRQVQVSTYAKNLGYIWRATKSGLDPTQPRRTYPEPFNIAFSLRVGL